MVRMRRFSKHAKCACCGAPYELERDHIIPLSKGGTDDPENTQLLCHRCNHSKGTGERCQISHGLDTILPKHIKNQYGINGAEVSELGEMSSKARTLSRVKKPQINPQVNWRVEQTIAQEIESLAKQQGVGSGKIIKDLWRGHHAEVIHRLETIERQHADILVIIGEILTLIRQPLRVVPDETPEVDPFAYRYLQPSKSPSPVPDVPPSPPKRRFWQRWKGQS